MRAIWVGAMVALAGCAGGIVPRSAPLAAVLPATLPVPKGVAATPRAASAAATPATPTPSTLNARSIGVYAGPDVAKLAVAPATAARAVSAFKASCPSLLRRIDNSGLTQASDWSAACAAADGAPDAIVFFGEQFEAVRVGSGQAFATGYYEPEILGSRTRDDAHQVPIYGKPTDLVELDLGQFADALKGKTIRGRVVDQTFAPYAERSDIDAGALAGHAPVIAWAADPIEFFFLQIQGSGRLRLPDGSVMRIGFAGQNGRDYTGIGALMRDRGLVGPGQLSMQGIMAWLRAHPDDGRAIMNENKSFVFFREIIAPGPPGSLGVAVTPRGTVAADPSFVPLGAPVWLDLDHPEATGLWVAQDTGGAIKGANRFDTFWGAGDEARRIAGGMSGRGSALILVPRGTLARLTASATPTQR